MNNKIVVCIGKGGQKDMAESFSRRTGSPIVNKPGDYLTVLFDSKGVSLSGFGLSYQGDFENARAKAQEYVEKYPSDERGTREYTFLQTR